MVFLIAANRANAQQSCGPGDTKRTRQNAQTHGFLAKKLAFRDEESKAAFDTLLNELGAEYQPTGRTELALVEEIAVSLWRIQGLNAAQQKELDYRKNVSRAILTAVVEQEEEHEPVPRFVEKLGSHTAAVPWHCHELVVRTTSRSDQHEEVGSLDDTTDKRGGVQIEARLHTSLDSIVRYTAAAKRDLYRAITVLRQIQRERREQD